MSGYSSYSAGVSPQDLQVEAQRMQYEAQMTQLMFKLHDQCWTKCGVVGNSTGLGSREKSCVRQCTGRFFDVQKALASTLADSMKE
jgi:hypothetical protein|tara:strand:- start:147 stop:404 length:258 start_codon:yes stop_codon:yes gene_type:complete